MDIASFHISLALAPVFGRSFGIRLLDWVFAFRSLHHPMKSSASRDPYTCAVQLGRGQMPALVPGPQLTNSGARLAMCDMMLVSGGDCLDGATETE